MDKRAECSASLSYVMQSSSTNTGSRMGSPVKGHILSWGMDMMGGVVVVMFDTVEARGVVAWLGMGGGSGALCGGGMYGEDVMTLVCR